MKTESRTTASSNFEKTRREVGYLPLQKSTPSVYADLGFKCGLEVHQQLVTEQKLFCRCAAGLYHDFGDYHAEIIRHMRPTLSELGEYDGTALMEFKTRKEIVYRINNRTACTYEIDDTPPFPVNREALKIALKIALLFKTNIVGELHITRKQYLDGSIPTGFQRTAIVGVEGEFALAHKKIRVIQLSLEEDSCREISDIGHRRVFSTDRLGIPLIETVTYPDMSTPQEAFQAGQYIRFITRSSGLVRTGIGAAREDVNVSITGGTRVEIKGVSHLKWIPRLTHNEAFRQKALLRIRNILNHRIVDPQEWKPQSRDITEFLRRHPAASQNPFVGECPRARFVAIRLPGFQGILSHFLQPGLTFASELENRLKVIACIEKPNMTGDESLATVFSSPLYSEIGTMMESRPDDSMIIIRGPLEDIPTAVETIEERCRLAFSGVPNETRKALENGTTVFERVLPGPDRMYPDTDSAPIPIRDATVETLKKDTILSPQQRIEQMNRWKVPVDTYTFLLKRNYFPLMKRIVEKLGYPPSFVGALLGHRLKHVEGQLGYREDFDPSLIYDLFQGVAERKLCPDILHVLLLPVYRENRCHFPTLLKKIHYVRSSDREIQTELQRLVSRSQKTVNAKNPQSRIRWIMGKIRPLALGNIPLARLQKQLTGEIHG